MAGTQTTPIWCSWRWTISTSKQWPRFIFKFQNIPICDVSSCSAGSPHHLNSRLEFNNLLMVSPRDTAPSFNWPFSPKTVPTKIYWQKKEKPLKYSLHLNLFVKAEREANPSPHLLASKLLWEKLTIKISSTSRCSNDLAAESRPSAQYCLREGLTWETLWNLWQNWTGSKNPSASLHKHFTFTGFHNFIFLSKFSHVSAQIVCLEVSCNSNSL